MNVVPMGMLEVEELRRRAQANEHLSIEISGSDLLSLLATLDAANELAGQDKITPGESAAIHHLRSTLIYRNEMILRLEKNHVACVHHIKMLRNRADQLQQRLDDLNATIARKTDV